MVEEEEEEKEEEKEEEEEEEEEEGRSQLRFKCRDFAHAAFATGIRAPTRSKSSHSMTHVMFSYNWDHQELVLDVFRVLKSKGIDIWVDVQGSSRLGKMAGNTDEMMIKATAPCPAFVKRRFFIHTRFICRP